MSTIRIIAGTLRRRHIKVLDVQDLRPTPERLREALFNSLGQNLQGINVLDVFAGSGAMAFEAYSRGANVLGLEYNKTIFNHLKQTAQQLDIKAGIQFKCINAFNYLPQIQLFDYDVYLFDPPYRLEYMADIFNQLVVLLKKIKNINCLDALNALNASKKIKIYCEHNQSLEELISVFIQNTHNLNVNVTLYKNFKVGQIYAYLLSLEIGLHSATVLK
jgi:16S rRNA (guanine966-N2)-methyltransferase